MSSEHKYVLNRFICARYNNAWMQIMKKIIESIQSFQTNHPALNRIIETIVSTGAMVLLVLIVYFLNVPNPNMVLVVGEIAFTALFGFIPGGFATLTMLGYSFFFFSTNHNFVSFTEQNAYKLYIIIFGAVTCYAFVAVLRFLHGRAAKKLRDASIALAEDNLHLDHISKIDSLTGVKNRFAFRLDFQSFEGKPINLLLLDVDDFKSINDHYGHATGDAVLHATGTILKEIFGEDHCYRYGGDEFMVVRDDLTPDEFISKCQDLRQAISEIRENSIHIPVKFSAGLVYGDAKEHSDMQLMLKEADRLLYTVKDSGKDDLKTVRFTVSNKA